MSDAFELQEPQDAKAFLEAFDRATRRKGEDYFHGGRVTNLACREPGTSYTASVQGSALYESRLFYETDEGWMGSCTCPMEFDCKHIYATMKALLAEHSVAAVRGLSAGTRGTTKAGPARKQETRPDASFADKVKAAWGHPLEPDEAKFLRKLSEAYARCRNTRRITRWDFTDLGLNLGGYGWDALQIWPSFPENEHEFWLYVAHAAMEHHLPLPDFLAPVTDLRPIEERLARWRRGREVQRWEQTLALFQGGRAGGPVQSRGLFDLRLKVGDKMACLEWMRAGQEAFESVKATLFRQFAEDFKAGLVELPPEAELLWQVFEQRLYFGRSVELRFHDPDALDVINRLVRARALHSRIVNADGRAFHRAAEPLRWELAPAASEQEDYRLRLVDASGAPPPPVLFALSGHPTLYVTRDTVFSGPLLLPEVLEPAAENVIPAPALESRGGVEFLQSIGVELPPRIRERVRQVPVEVAIHCELAPSYAGSKTEHCFVRVFAQSTDGQVKQICTGDAWQDTEPVTARPKSAPKNERVLTLYDRALAHQVPRLLEPLALRWDGYLGGLYLRVTKKFPEVFVPWLKTLPPAITVKLAGDLASLAQDAVSGNVRLDVTETTMDWFDLRVVIDVSDTTLTQEELKLLLNAKGSFVRLGEKGWRRLQFNLTQDEDERLARLGLSPHELTAEPQRLHALQLADEAAKKFLPEEQVAQVQRRASEIKARVTPDLPAGVQAELRPYQRDGFHFLAYLATNHFGGILADDMGLGKTLQALAWMLWLREETRNPKPETRNRPSLVVCPKSVMDNWRAEAERFTPGLRVKMWRASELNTLLDRLNEADLHVLNYSQLRLIGEGLVPAQWLAVILDEGQYIKNPNSQTAQVARALHAEHRLILSGTPIENRLLDLWSLMSFAMPGVLGSRAQFARMFDAKEDPFARRRLASRVRPFLLRRTKTQVAKDLPDRIEEDLFCEIEGEQKTLYRAELKRAQQLLLRVKTQKQLAQERFNFLTSLLRLRQICCHPALVKPESKAVSAKVEALLEQLEPLMEEGNKVLVFSQFVEMLGLLKPALADKGWKQFYLAGDTENRGELVKEFQAAEGAAVFLISLKAGGFGLNLTAASYVVLFDPWWNPAVENQAIDRTHRIGQTRKVIAYRLLIKDSIEEKIRALQKQKSALADDVLGEEKFSQSLTLDDLQFLFAD